MAPHHALLRCQSPLLQCRRSAPTSVVRTSTGDVGRPGVRPALPHRSARARRRAHPWLHDRDLDRALQDADEQANREAARLAVPADIHRARDLLEQGAEDAGSGAAAPAAGAEVTEGERSEAKECCAPRPLAHLDTNLGSRASLCRVLSGRTGPLLDWGTVRSSPEALGSPMARRRIAPSEAVTPTAKARSQAASSCPAMPRSRAEAPMLEGSWAMAPRCRPTASPEWSGRDAARLLRSVAMLIDPPRSTSHEVVSMRLLNFLVPSDSAPSVVLSGPAFSEIWRSARFDFALCVSYRGMAGVTIFSLSRAWRSLAPPAHIWRAARWRRHGPHADAWSKSLAASLGKNGQRCRSCSRLRGCALPLTQVPFERLPIACR